MIIKDFDANIYYLELEKVKGQELDAPLWYRFDKIQKKLANTFSSVQGLVKKINSENPAIDNLSLANKLVEALKGAESEYNIEKIPFSLLTGVKGNWNILQALIEMPEEKEEPKPEESKL